MVWRAEQKRIYGNSRPPVLRYVGRECIEQIVAEGAAGIDRWQLSLSGAERFVHQAVCGGVASAQYVAHFVRDGRQ